ncbi:hypothetical protein SAMN04488515_0347 [Cognatiyoonia koreensis]|uniref:Uncharacterized protein n=1 Tax=Cognatiyoonia koreensis TaxID=364200 RepID=A0A1I0N142_9RHOB|nr:hypothetical protein [Cognatiyoonia koreensis]SEV94525.1 hypothetical protein SAMN04488515_0347 [Cognatiyoonia koreensis]
MLRDIVDESLRLTKTFGAVKGINPKDISKTTYFVSSDDIFAAFRPAHICDMPLDDIITKQRVMGVVMLQTVGDLRLRDGTYGIHLRPEDGAGILSDANGEDVARAPYEAVMPITAPPTTAQGIDIEFSGKCSVGIDFPLSLSVKCYGGAQSPGGGIGVTVCNNLTIDLTPFIL